MGVEYLLAWPCPLKEYFSIMDLIRLVKVGDQAHYILRQLRADGDNRATDDIKIVRQRRTPEGVHNEEISVQAMLDEASLLQPHQKHCYDCPANVFHRPVGCYGYINYPIKRETEEWLLSRLPEQLGCTAGAVLQQVVQEVPYDGQPISRLRQYEMLFESSTPAERRWSTPAGEWILTGDQLLHMLITLGQLAPQQAILILLFLGFLPHNLDPQLLTNPAIFLERSWLSQDHPNPQIQSFIHFTDALRIAIRQNTATLMDY